MQARTEFDLVFVGLGDGSPETQERVRQVLNKQCDLDGVKIARLLEEAPLSIRRYSSEDELKIYFDALTLAGAELLVVECVETEQKAENVIPQETAEEPEANKQSVAQESQTPQTIPQAELKPHQDQTFEPIQLKPEVVEIEPGATPADMFYAAIEHQKHNRQMEAEILYRKAIAQHQRFFEAHLNLGNILFQREEYEEALQHYREVVRIRVNSVEGWFNLGNCLGKLDKYEEAVDAYKQVLKHDPVHPAANINMEYIYRKMDHYDPRKFYVENEHAARRIILTGEADMTSKERWEKETPFVVNTIGSKLSLDSSKLVLDFGCGIGRVAKGIIDTYDCHIIGADLSPQMQELGIQYVNSDKFSVCYPEMLDVFRTQGLQVDAAYSVWVLQHVLHPDEELDRIAALLKPGGKLFIINSYSRLLPRTRGWNTDRIDVHRLLRERFEEVESFPLPEGVIPKNLAALSFGKVFQKRTIQ